MRLQPPLKAPTEACCLTPAKKPAWHSESNFRFLCYRTPNNLATLRHMVLNLMQKDKTKGSLRGKFNAPDGTRTICQASSCGFRFKSDTHSEMKPDGVSI